MSTRVAIVNGYVLSMDPGIGELERGTVLIEDDRIAAVGSDLGELDARTIDAPRRRGDAGLRRHPPPHLADRACGGSAATGR